MSNAKVAAMIAEANQHMIEAIDKTLAPIVQELAQARAELEQLQQAIAPMAAELEALRADARSRWERGTPLK